jgi:hypothetical protein
MTSVSDQAAEPGSRPAPDDRLVTDDGTSGAAPPEALTLTVGEVAALLAVCLVAAIASWSLALAQLGRHNGWLAVVLGVVTAAGGALLVVTMDRRPRIHVDLVELGLVAGVIIGGAIFFLPGFHYAYDDKDPGTYVAHAFAIAREGDVYIDDPVLERGLSPAFDQAGRFPGLWLDADRPNHVTSQFYHLYSSLLATAEDIGGPRALFNLTPLLAIGSCCLLVLATRRAAGTVVAIVAGALLVTSMMQVWQAKYPSTEIVAQLLLSGAILAAVLAIDRRWAGAAFVVGILAGTSFLARPDGFLYVLLTAGAAAIVIAAGRSDARVVAVMGGLAVSLPYAFWNAYVARDNYTSANSVPGPITLVGAVVLAIVAGVLVRTLLVALGRRFPSRQFDNPGQLLARWRFPLGVALSIAFGALFLVLFFRRQLFGEDYGYLHFTGRVERSYAEMNLPWLSWFVTVRGLVVMWLGLCVVLIQRWRASLFALIGTGLLLLPLYLYDARVSMRLMWWVRRFIPAVLPAIVILMAIAIGWALLRRWWTVRIAAGVLLATLIIEYAAMSLPLRDHDEMGGSWDLSAAIAAQSGTDDGLFLFPQPVSGIYDVERNAPGIVWFVFDRVGARLPDGYDITTIDEYQRAFPERPVYLVTPGEGLPGNLPAERFVKSGTVVGDVVLWEESREERPDAPMTTRWGVSIWQLTEPTGQPASG